MGKMGERAAYKVSQDGKSMFMVRKQWYLGSSHKELTILVKKIAEKLMTTRFESEKLTINCGSVALRQDLDINRLSMALVLTVGRDGFDEIVLADDLNCDINDHGVYEIDLIKWNIWEINQYDVPWEGPNKDKLGIKKHLATVTFKEGKTLEDGMRIEFLVPDNWGYPDET
jgi:hypothetical protein